MAFDSDSPKIVKDVLSLRDGWLKNPDYDCFWSSPGNEKGLRLTPTITPGKVTTQMLIEKHHSGFPGICHGGVPFTVLDGMMSWYLMAHFGRGGFTRSATINYSRPLFVSKTYKFEVTRDESAGSTDRSILLKGQVSLLGDERDEVVISMNAGFILPSKSLAEKILGKDIVEFAADIFPES